MEFINDVVEKGGPLIYPLALLLLWSLYIIVVKGVGLRRNRIIRHDAVEELEKLLIGRNIPEATAYCKQNSFPMTRVLLAAILNYEKEETELKGILEEAGRQEIPAIRKHLTALGTIASVAPLLGLLGTVLGMISVFTTLSEQSSVNAGMLAGGISEALITTAIGMVVALPALSFYNFFISRVQNLVIEMERISLHMVAVLKRA